MSITALFYNWGFFTLLGYAPFPMRLGVHQLGYVFAGWGLLLAIFSVFVAPRLQHASGHHARCTSISGCSPASCSSLRSARPPS